MKSEKGITLVSLVTYIAVMIIVLVVMNSIITIFYNNNQGVRLSVKEIIEFNKFNIYFLKEIKAYNNSVDTIDSKDGNPYIIFESGNSFLFKDNRIYYNNIIICSNLKNVKFENETNYRDDGEEEIDKSIVIVSLEFENFRKTMKYKIENIY